MKIEILTNLLTPYRKFFFDALNKELITSGGELHVLVMEETEDNRPWVYSDFASSYTELLPNCRFSIGGIYLSICKGVKKKLREYSPDILVVSGSYLMPAVSTAVRYARSTNTPVLFWSESHLDEEREYGKLKLWLREIIRRKFYNSVDGFWYPGKLAKQFIIKYAGPNAKFIQVPNLVDPACHSISVTAQRKAIEFRSNLQINGKLLLCPARLHPSKGLLEFVQQIAAFGKNRNYTLLIAGEGPLKSDLERLSKQCGLDIRLIGQLSPEDLRIAYDAADAFILPSKSDPNPLSCIEASWHALPLFISNHVGNYPEVVSEGVNGFVFSYDHRDEAIKKWDAFLAMDNEWYSNARQYSRRNAESNFSPDVVTQRIISEFETIVATISVSNK